MATRSQTIDDLLDALRDLPGLRARKMFGEYGLYLGNKVVGFVCDDTLYVKPTPSALAVVTDPVLAPAYPGSKDYICMEGALDDTDLTIAALRAVADDVPEPVPKTRRKVKT